MTQEIINSHSGSKLTRADFISKSFKGALGFSISNLFLNELISDPGTIAYKTSFHSPEGHYSIPIKVAENWTVSGTGDPNEETHIREYVEKHSKENLWTYNLMSVNKLNPDILRLEKGIDMFIRVYDNGAPTNLLVFWEKTNVSLQEDYKIRKALVENAGCKWHPELEKSVQIDGIKGIMGKFTRPMGNNITECSTNILMHKDNKKYEMRLIYYDNYNDPGNTIDSVVMKLKFDKK